MSKPFKLVGEWLVRNFYITVIVTSAMLMMLVTLEMVKREIMAGLSLNRQETLTNRDKGEAILREQSAVRAAVETKTADRWTKSDHEHWLEELKRLNPTVRLPEDGK